MWSAIAAIGSAILSSVIGNVGAKNRQDAMNAYNAPAAQMARYASAGLNPNLIYGQGSAGNQPSATPFMTPEVDPIQIYSATQAAAESKTRREVNILRAQNLQIKNMYDALLKEQQSKYFSQNAQYQSEIMKNVVQKTALEPGVMAQHLKNLQADERLKGLVGKEKVANIKQLDYYNNVRQFGIERGDSPFWRIGLQMIPHIFNPKLRRQAAVNDRLWEKYHK